MSIVKYLRARTLANLRVHAALAESTRAAAQRSLEANVEFLQGSMNTWTQLLTTFTMIPYYRERPEQLEAWPSKGSIEESEFLRAASMVIRDHAEALRELSNSE